MEEGEEGLTIDPRLTHHASALDQRVERFRPLNYTYVYVPKDHRAPFNFQECVDNFKNVICKYHHPLSQLTFLSPEGKEDLTGEIEIRGVQYSKIEVRERLRVDEIGFIADIMASDDKGMLCILPRSLYDIFALGFCFSHTVKDKDFLNYNFDLTNRIHDFIIPERNSEQYLWSLHYINELITEAFRSFNFDIRRLDICGPCNITYEIWNILLGNSLRYLRDYYDRKTKFEPSVMEDIRKSILGLFKEESERNTKVASTTFLGGTYKYFSGFFKRESDITNYADEVRTIETGVLKILHDFTMKDEFSRHRLYEKHYMMAEYINEWINDVLSIAKKNQKPTLVTLEELKNSVDKYFCFFNVTVKFGMKRKYDMADILQNKELIFKIFNGEIISANLGDLVILYRGSMDNYEAVVQKGDDTKGYSLSYNASVFCGYLYDSTACTFNYFKNFKKRDRSGDTKIYHQQRYVFHRFFYDDKTFPDNILYIPPLHPLEQLLSEGEFFHVRSKFFKDTKIDDNMGNICKYVMKKRSENLPPDDLLPHYLKSVRDKDELQADFAKVLEDSKRLLTYLSSQSADIPSQLHLFSQLVHGGGKKKFSIMKSKKLKFKKRRMSLSSKKRRASRKKTKINS
jgi:hypothetical protein